MTPTVICAWCKTILSHGSATISHGICPKCKTKLEAEIRTRTTKGAK